LVKPIIEKFDFINISCDNSVRYSSNSGISLCSIQFVWYWLSRVIHRNFDQFIITSIGCSKIRILRWQFYVINMPWFNRYFKNPIFNFMIKNSILLLFDCITAISVRIFSLSQQWYWLIKVQFGILIYFHIEY
jgi:hypothetical protein